MKGEKLRAAFVLGALAFSAYVFVPACFGEPSSVEVTRMARYDAERAAGAQVRASLRDPGSAKFRDVRAAGPDSALVVCGYVNAKNGLGGFTGDTPFVVDATGVTVDGRVTTSPAWSACAAGR
jgi:hypothetical protein